MYDLQDDDDIYMEDCELEYSEGSSSEGDANLENLYYASKALKEDNNDLNAALVSFEKLLHSEDSMTGDWGIKALKQIIKINFKLKNYDEMMVRYKQLLKHGICGAFSSNHSRKFINNTLDRISTIKNASLVHDFYKITIKTLKEAKKGAFWFKINLKLARLYFDGGDFGQLSAVLRELRESCLTETGEEDGEKGSQLLEIYAMEIQIHTVHKDNRKLIALYKKSLRITSTAPHPLVMGVIRECGGKIHLDEQKFDEARHDFFEAFKNYDESGSARRTTCLKYLFITHMLMRSDNINLLESPEINALRTDKEVIAITDLLSAYEINNLENFERILKSHQIKDDPLFTEYSQGLLESIRSRVIVNMTKPYNRVYLSYIRKELNMNSDDEVEEFLVRCIVNGTVRGRIDQVNQTLQLNRGNGASSPKYTAMDKWSSRISSLIEKVTAKESDLILEDDDDMPAPRVPISCPSITSSQNAPYIRVRKKNKRSSPSPSLPIVRNRKNRNHQSFLPVRIVA